MQKVGLRLSSWTVLGFLGVAAASQTASANQLTYTPVNPSFGGSPLNGSYELGLATANNYKFLNPPSANNTPASAQQNFASEITSALLSQIASSVSQTILGPNAQNSGTFNLSGDIIQFNRAGGQVNINITDATTGATTNIQIPAPTF